MSEQLTAAPLPVVNASPLILLFRIGSSELLRIAGPEIIAPHAVLAELAAKDDGAAEMVRSISWMRIMATPVIPEIIRAADLGAGETAVLALASAHPGTTAIVDDRAARSFAARLGIPVRGTLGLVLTAKRRGQIQGARPVVDRLRRAGMRITDCLSDAALALVGE